MPRPQNKDELIKAINAEFSKLCKIVDETPKDILNKDFINPLPSNSRDKNARDVLIHLYEWQVMLQNFISNNLDFKGGKFTPKAEISPFLPPPYNWHTYPKLNVEIWQKHQSTDFESALDLLESSHQSILSIAQKFSDNELFDKKHFAFTGTTNLGSYVISASCSHYAWAIKQLKSGLKHS
ncbi:ClbS/DfsB family four-helix bundle protein [Helicobacter macacae]|uniref:DinB-like domain-containing protein n=1 Tax=Helicobacter macacae MIT 99-5501 TaxID=1357400 RepID=V8CA54_9HELI|nr:ClbS/DfsB family four-helix bundle protein [Helicobacter macacae]ETD23942.1 hypothetical protein HMPREF2086_00688 [Helicobacter macacae MIT 99-5501]